MVYSFLKKPSHERLAVTAILACGVVERFAWVLSAPHMKPIINESHNIAASLARTGKFADAFFIGSGWTAHLGMLTPLPSAAVYWLFGVDSLLAEFVLSVWSVCIVSIGYWLCWRMACALGTTPVARVAAIALVSLMPIQFFLEIREGRSWEVNLAVALLLWILLRVVRMDRKEFVSAREVAVTGAITGFLFIISPPAGLAAILTMGLFQLLRLPFRRWWIAPAGFALVTGLLGGFWMARNVVRMGEPIALRDDLGLELDLSNYSGAVHPAVPHAAYVARLHDIHPSALGPGISAMHAAGGEVPYYHKLGRDAEDWIVAHPSDFLYLCARRFVQFYLPPKWFWFTYGAPGKILWLRQFLAWATVISGLCTLAVLAWRRRDYAYLLVAALACSLPYIVIDPTLRYRYLISSLLIFCAFDGISQLIMHLVITFRTKFDAVASR